MLCLISFKFQALRETAMTRMILPAPILIIPPIFMTLLEKYVPLFIITLLKLLRNDVALIIVS